MRNYTVYKHTNTVNGKVYIGITSCVPEDRWNKGYGYRSCRYFYNAIRKYGWDAFSHEILFANLTREEAESKEIELIAHYRVTGAGCYNILCGGRLGRTGIPLSPDVRKKLSESNRGRSLSEEHKRKLSKAHMGKILSEDTRKKMSENNARYWRGKNRDPETIEKLRQSHLGKTHSPEIRAKISASNIGRKLEKPWTQEHLGAISRSTRKAVLQMDLQGNPLHEWVSMRAAADHLNKKYINLISECCRGERRTAYGYRWKIINNKGE